MWVLVVVVGGGGLYYKVMNSQKGYPDMKFDTGTDNNEQWFSKYLTL